MGGALAASAAFTIVPRHVLGGPGHTPPSEKLNMACIGTGCQGLRDLQTFLNNPDVQMVAVCDANKSGSNYDFDDSGTAGSEPARQIVESYYANKKPSGKFKGCATYSDFRELLVRKDIDSVIVATPDHLHAPISMMAAKTGKHIYCEKPLTHTVYEARMLARAAREAGVATQMGNQHQAHDGIRLMCEWIWDGAIGDVREVHNWIDAPTGRWPWPQGVDKPTDKPPVPEGLDWDLWLGPAPYRPYHPAYHPWAWRGWCDFGEGALGDFGCHSFAPIFKVLKLEHPISVEASSTKFNGQTYPLASIVHYEFGARGDMPPVKLIWYDGGLMPARPDELEQGREMNKYGGALFVGDKGKMMGEPYNSRLIPESKMKAYKRPPKTLRRSPGHYQEWIDACKGGKPAGSNFEFASLVTEVVLLGNIALRTGKKLYWDGANMKITNVPDANKYLHYQYRQEWSL